MDRMIRVSWIDDEFEDYPDEATWIAAYPEFPCMGCGMPGVFEGTVCFNCGTKGLLDVGELSFS